LRKRTLCNPAERLKELKKNGESVSEAFEGFVAVAGDRHQLVEFTLLAEAVQ
jgi:hypothetical protein